MIRPAELIERKRDGEELSAEELSELVLGYTRGDIPDYQMSAFLMAVYFRGLSGAETFALTDAMIASGETIDLGSALGRKVVDKHSTGGVGDKTSLAVGPIVAACGVPFGKMSGRGLGHTGGTLDKLESIPGFRVELTVDELVAQVREVGIAIIGQTGDLVPADKLLYALRDVTATVDNVSLIAASIMSKKIAGGAEAIVLDVKVGDGAFMKTLDDARVLAETMIELGRRAAARRSACSPTWTSRSAAPSATRSRCARRSTRCAATGRLTSPSSSWTRVRTCSRSPTSAWTMPRADGSRSRRSRTVPPPRSGAGGSRRRAEIPTRVRCPRRGSCARSPRRGRATSGGWERSPSAWPRFIWAPGGHRRSDEIDHAVGVVCHRKRGDAVEEGDVLAEVHARDEASAAAAVDEVLAAYEIGDMPPEAHPLVLDVLA